MTKTGNVGTAHASKPRPLFFAMLVALLCVPGGIIGCGEEGPTRHQVSGKVTFGGRPVPAGTIFFTPDASKGNKGPQGVAQIKDGQYDTAVNGKGSISGPVIVKIIGFEKIPENEDDPSTPLFPEWTTNVEIPESDSTQDFQVPADAQKQSPSKKADVEP